MKLTLPKVPGFQLRTCGTKSWVRLLCFMILGAWFSGSLNANQAGPYRTLETTLERPLTLESIAEFSRPKIPSSELARQVRLRQKTMPSRGLSPGHLQKEGVAVGDIFVIQGDNQTVVNDGGDYSFNLDRGIQTVIDDVWRSYGDVYDFISVFTTFDAGDADAGFAAFYIPLQNDVQGIGGCNRSNGELIGCDPGFFPSGVRLQGFVLMNSLNFWQMWNRNYSGVTRDLSDFRHSVYPTMGQEITHRWLAGIRYVDPRSPGSAPSLGLLGRDLSHWSALLDADGSVQDGCNWESNADGSWAATESMTGYSALDLYGMGAIAPVELGRLSLLENGILENFQPGRPLRSQSPVCFFDPTFVQSQFGDYIRVRGSELKIGARDIVNAEGSRLPTLSTSPKGFRQLFVLVTAPTDSASLVDTEIERLNEVRLNWEEWFRIETQGRMRICTASNTLCSLSDLQVDSAASFETNIDQENNGRTMLPLTLDGGAVAQLEVDAEIVSEHPSASVNVNAELPSNIGPGSAIDLPLEFSVPLEEVCNETLRIAIEAQGDGLARYREELPLFVGGQVVYEETFAESTGEYIVEGEGSGQLTYMPEVLLSAESDVDAPFRDASYQGKGAFVSEDGGLLFGTTQLTSPPIQLGDTERPRFEFGYWFRGSEGSLLVALSVDGGDFEPVDWSLEQELDVNGWRIGRVDLVDVIETQPGTVQIRFEFASAEGAVVGVDDVRVIENVSECLGEVSPWVEGDAEANVSGCACEQSRLDLFGLLIGFFAMNVRTRIRRRETKPAN